MKKLGKTKRPLSEASDKETKPAKRVKTDQIKTHSQKPEKNTTNGTKKEAKKKKVDYTKQNVNGHVNWVEYKKKKKELRTKRRQNKDCGDILPRVKQLGEKIRRKILPGGNNERNEIVSELHSLLNKKGNYRKVVLSHDMARLVQYILKFGTTQIREDISKELIPITKDMLQSKYGKYCVKRILKYGSPETRSSLIRQFYGSVVKIVSHSVSAPIFEYAYSTFATQQEKHHLIQEFFGDMYKSSKEDGIKHLRDVYKDTPTMKNAVLSATKANLLKVLNKELLDSGLVQAVLYQFLTECSEQDRDELIAQLAEHIVIISNSKAGSRVGMQCIWHGTNKDRKIIMKALKEHIIELSKHEHGHCTIISLLDAIDDTVLLNKILLGEIIKHAQELANDEWGRKVILWLVAPYDKAHFHPVFTNELQTGRENSKSKKSPDIRQSEILNHCSQGLTDLISGDPKFWFSKASVAVVALAILKTGNDPQLGKALENLANLIVDPQWKVKDGDAEIQGIEHAGLHMVLKKLLQHDKIAFENSKTTFGDCLNTVLNDDTVQKWTTLNRACFLLVMLLENNSESTKNDVKEKISKYKKVLKKEKFAGAKILLAKCKSC